jgi:hypothetical protein
MQQLKLNTKNAEKINVLSYLELVPFLDFQNKFSRNFFLRIRIENRCISWEKSLDSLLVFFENKFKTKIGDS